MPALRKIKLFISHASEDKIDFVEPLVRALEATYEVWYDKKRLTMGDSLFQKISAGIKECDYGVVVFSHAFFSKKWTQAEIDGLYALQSTVRKVILPIWKGVTVEDVKIFSPIFAGMWAAQASEGVNKVVERIGQAIALADQVAAFSEERLITMRIQKLGAEIQADAHSVKMLKRAEGAAVLRAELQRTFKAICTSLTEWETNSGLSFKRDKSVPHEEPRLVVICPYEIRGKLKVWDFATNTVASTRLVLKITRLNPERMDRIPHHATVFKVAFSPFIKRDNTIRWHTVGATYENAEIPRLFLSTLATYLEKEKELKRNR